MATILTRTWTAANGTSWSAVGFRRIVGAALDAVVQANAGACGASAGARVWMVEGFPQTPGHKVAVDLNWLNAAGAGRAPGVGCRWTDDGRNGYMAELDSNIGAARVRIRRRRNDAWTDLTGWVDVSGVVSSAALNAGVTCQLRCVNEVDQVALSFRIAGTERLAHDDTDADRIEDPGAPALLIDANSTVDDVTYDSLTVQDLADEYSGDPATLAVGVALVVDGVSYSYADLVSRGVFLGRGKQSYDQGDGWEFRTAALMDAEDDVLYPGAVVSVALDGTVVAFGRIQHASRRLAPGEGRAYRLVTARQLAADVDLSHPDTQADSITWNLQEDHADYDAAYAEKEVGEAVKLILDEHVDGTSGLRAHLAAPPDEDTPPYIQAELDLLTAKAPGMSGSGDPVAAIEQLLAFTKYLLVIDPATRIWHFKDRTAGTIVQVDLDAVHVLGDYEIDPERNHTAFLLRGSKPEATAATLDSDAIGGLEPQWPASLEATRTDEKSQKNRDQGLVDSIGGTAGAPTMTPDMVGPPAFSMDALEWVLCRITFDDGAEVGNTYPVLTNSNLAFTLVGPWVAGGPAAGDAFTVQGDALNGGRDNAYTEIGRRWKLTDLDKGIPDDACARIKIIQDKITKLTTAKVITPTDPTQPAELVTDLPAIGLVNYAPQTAGDACGMAGADAPAVVEAVELPTYSRADRSVPRHWFPRDGSGNDAYRGSAFTTDPAKWSGGGTPGYGDPGRMSPFRQHAPEFTGSAAERAEWDLVAAELLSFMAALARSVTVTVHGVLDTTCAGLGKRIQILGGPPELETTEELTLLAIEWDPAGPTTTYYAGTFAAGPYDIQRMREEMVARNVKRRVKRDQFSLEKIRDCLTGNLHSAGYARELAPTKICGERVGTAATGDGRSVVEDLEVIILWIEEIWDWLYAQKGFLVEIDDDGNLWVQDPDGDWTYSTDGGLTWTSDVGGEGPGGGVAGPGDVGTGDPKPTHPEDLGDTSIEGIIWNAIEGLLANLGKTVDQFGHVLDPGDTVPVGGGTQYGHNASGDITKTPISAGNPVPPTVIGGIQANKAALEKLLLGHEKSADHVVPATVESPDGSIYTPSGTGYTRLSGAGLDAPQIGGAVGGLAGKCGSTFDGKGTFASGPGTILEPGSTVPADGAYYHPPTDDPADVVQLASGDTVPASTPDQLRALADDNGLTVADLADPGGAVFVDEAYKAGTLMARFWRCEPGTTRFIEVSGTIGTGLNGGDWTDVSPTRYHEGPALGGTMKRAVRLATTAALAANTLAEPLLTANANGVMAAVDGGTPAIGDRLLVKDEATQTKHGLWTVQEVGSGGTPWILRRTRDTASEDSTLSGALVLVRAGTVNALVVFKLDNTGVVTPGTTNQTWSRWNPPGASTTEVLTGTDAAKPVTSDALAALWEQGSDVASGATISLGEGGHFHITGTTDISDIDFATDKAGRHATLRFANSLTLTHGANLICPEGRDLKVHVDDVVTVVSEGSDVVRVVAHQHAYPRLMQFLSGTDTGGNVNTAQPWFPTDPAVTLKAACAYRFEGLLWLSRSAGITSHTVSLLFGGTATLTSIMYLLQTKSGDVATLSGGMASVADVATATVAKGASTSATEQAVFMVKGIVRVNAGGTFEPQFKYDNAPGGVPTIKANSYFRLEYLGPGTAAEIGAWA